MVDQLGDQEDPLQKKLRHSFEERQYGGSGGEQRRRSGQHKRTRFQTSGEFEEKGHQSGALRKEDIDIPNPTRKPISRAAKLLAIVMAPNDGPSRMHGLHGKKLMSVTSLPVMDQDSKLTVFSTDISLVFSFHWASFSLDTIKALCLASSRK